MKKLFLTLLFSLAMASVALAAGTATGRLVHQAGDYRVYRIIVEAGDEGAFTNWSTKDEDANAYNLTGYIYQAVTYPGTTSPTVGYTVNTAPVANYDITLYNSGGYDVFGTQLNNRSTSTPQLVKPLLNGNDTGIMNYGPLTLKLENVTQTEALVTIDIYFTRLN